MSQPIGRKPSCEDCGTAVCHPWKLEGTVGYHWLCGSCRYLRENPTAPRAAKLPRQRSKRLQKETLFDIGETG